MQTLLLNYKKNGYNYQQIYRNGDVAIYEQHYEGTRVAYEVCQIIQAEAGEVFGKWMEAREKLPSTEQWGSKAFTVHSLERAFEKAKELEEKVKEAAESKK